MFLVTLQTLEEHSIESWEKIYYVDINKIVPSEVYLRIACADVGIY